jgi:tetratricopeptide (TPR) repeat protein
MKHLILFVIVAISFGCYYPKIIIHGNPGKATKSLFDTCNSKECLNEVIKRDPNNVEAHWWLGTKLQAEQNYLQAINEFDIAIKLDSTYNLGYPYRDRANCKNNLGNDSGAVLDMNAAIRHNPTERYFYVDRGTYLYNLKKYDLALADFNKALEIWDNYFEARVWKAKTLVELKNYKDAIAEYKILNFSDEFINNPNNTYDIYDRGLAKFYTNDKDGACSDWTIIANRSEEAKVLLTTNCK